MTRYTRTATGGAPHPIEMTPPFVALTAREGSEDTFKGKEGAMVGAIILGIVAGYVGRLLMPGRDKMGFIMTMILGIAGSIVGFLVFTELLGIGDDQMFDLGGLIGAIIGVMILLALYRVALKNKEHPLAR
jgi:uncharacterized membrane protein YeaQ/YmgE (transglycosylase-associated protein family)